MVGTKIFFTKGVGRHKDYLASFELALRDAGIEPLNIVTISSILPPACKVVPRDEGLKLLRPGQVAFCVMARQATNEPNRLIASSIGVAQPADSSTYGYLSEHHPMGETGQKAGDYAEDLAATMLATTLGIEFDPEQAWDDREQIYKASGKIIKTTNITQSAEGDKNGLWTTVLSAVVFVEFATQEQLENIPNLYDLRHQMSNLNNSDSATS
jgi:arginine decarboxylase